MARPETNTVASQAEDLTVNLAKAMSFLGWVIAVIFGTLVVGMMNNVNAIGKAQAVSDERMAAIVSDVAEIKADIHDISQKGG